MRLTKKKTDDVVRTTKTERTTQAQEYSPPPSQTLNFASTIDLPSPLTPSFLMEEYILGLKSTNKVRTTYENHIPTADNSYQPHTMNIQIVATNM
ncbi:MAG: hypothetical protein HC945_00120 [Nitrosarchaeum sp.]|nr:hypothetical protein [Nitrosarchaeum sp.]